MCGYYKHSMSNNAVMAYERGERPRSKWTKADIIQALKDEGYNTELAEGLTVEEMKDLFLYCSSWHHTSSHFNRTDFYSINTDVTKEQIESVKANRTNTNRKQLDTLRKAYVHYLTWEGTCKHPKPIHHEDFAIIKGNWALLRDGSKKSVTSNGFKIIDEFQRAPKGTTDTFKEILKEHNL